MKQALLFDMDGVLVDTERIHQAARLSVYRKYGIDPSRVAGVPVAGRNTDAIFTDVNALCPFPVPLGTAVLEKRRLFVSLLGSSLKPLPGVKPLLSLYLGKLKIALVSASARSTVEAAVNGAGLSGFFDLIIHADDVKAHKPDPACYRLAAERLSLPAGQCVVFEDTGIGVAAGKAAGATVIGVRTGYPGEDFSAADLVVGNLESGRERVIRLIKGETCR